MQEISVTEFESLDKSKGIILDVRTSGEVTHSSLPYKFTHIPLNELELRYKEIELDKAIYCLCHHGVRSQYAALMLESFGAKNTFNIIGGIDAYAKLINPEIPLY